MTPEEQRIAIGEMTLPKLFVIHKPIHDPFGYYRKDAKGYTNSLDKAWNVTEDVARWYVQGKPDQPDRVVAEPAPMPDYLNDLNAMHKAEKLVVEAGGTWIGYISALKRICTTDDGADLSWHATAAQRAEAFLRAIGKWKD